MSRRHPPPTLAHLLRARADAQPERAALSFIGEDDAREVLSYAALDLRARAVAGRLAEAKLRPGERAILAFPPGLDFVAAFLGCLYAGVIAVPVYPSLSGRHGARVLGIQQDAEAAAVLTTAEIAALVAGAFGASGGPAWIPASGVSAEYAAAAPELAGAADDVAFLQYTSGSTGTPRGVVLTHGNLLSDLEQIHRAFDASPERSGLIWLPHFHDMGLIGGILAPLYSGYPVELMSPLRFLKRPFRWLQELSQHRISYSGGPNFAYELCLQDISEEQLAGLDLSEWMVAFCGAEPVRAATLGRFAAALGPRGLRPTALYPCYGLAEATLLVTGKEPHARPTIRVVAAAALESGTVRSAGDSEHERRELVGCGRTWAGTEVEIVDPATALRCPPDRVGEIWVRGGGVARGYWRRPEETRAQFENFLADTGEGPFLRTGDLGFVADGQLFVTGRIKDLIIVDGRNLYPHDIEATVGGSHPVLHRQASVALSVEARGREGLVVVQELKSQVEDLDALASTIRSAVSREHHVPIDALVLVAARSLPKTSSGKLERRASRQALLGGQLPVLRAWGLAELLPGAAPPSDEASPTPPLSPIVMRPRPGRRVRLYCVPPAGAGASMFAQWPGHLPDHVEVRAVQLPGRESAARVPPIRDMTTLVDALDSMLAAEPPGPFFLFGHSMGARIAFALARRLRRRGAPGPRALILSASGVPPEAGEYPFYLDPRLPDDELLRRLVELGGMPPGLVDDEQLLRRLLFSLRADLEVVQHARFPPEPPLSCPILALAADDDRLVAPDEVAAWRAHTSAAFTMRTFPGDHFYLLNELPALIAEVSAAISAWEA